MRHAKMLNKATMPNGIVASIDPFWFGDALQKPEPFPPSVDGVASPLPPGTNCVGLAIIDTACVASPAVSVGLGVLVGSGVSVAVGTSVGVGDANTVGVGGTGVFVGVGMGVSVGVGVGVTVGVSVGKGVAVCVGVGVSVGVWVAVGEGVIVGVYVGVAVGVSVGSRSGNTRDTFSKLAPLTITPGGDRAFKNLGAPEGSFRSTR